jgi:hypothetical protein
LGIRWYSWVGGGTHYIYIYITIDADVTKLRFVTGFEKVVTLEKS